MPLASPNAVSASCIAPASFSESSTPNTVTSPAEPLPGVGGSVVLAPAAVVSAAPAVVLAPAAVVAPPPVVVFADPLSSSSPQPAATNANVIGIAASLSQLLIDSPLLFARVFPDPCKRFQTDDPWSRGNVPSNPGPMALVDRRT